MTPRFSVEAMSSMGQTVTDGREEEASRDSAVSASPLGLRHGQSLPTKLSNQTRLGINTVPLATQPLVFVL